MTMFYKFSKKSKQGQVTIEFMFSMIVVLLMIYALVMIFRWGGIDLIGRRQSHESKLLVQINEHYGACRQFNMVTYTCDEWFDIHSGPMQQLDPNFCRVVPMNAIWTGKRYE